MQDKDKTRRKVLIGLTSAVGLSGLPFAATPFIAAWNPSAKAKAAGAAVKLDVSKMQYGQQIQVSWRKQPVFIVRHTEESISSLDLALSKLADPNSDQIEEPYRGLNPSRSKSPEYSVFSGVCTHLGCAPKYFPEVNLSHGMQHGMVVFFVLVMDQCLISLVEFLKEFLHQRIS